MNVYTCWYQGNLGYGCRTRGRKWMFVPELGQPDGRVYRGLHLDDLIFKNRFERQAELIFETGKGNFSVIRFLLSLLFPGRKPRTVGGLLFTTT